MFLYILPGIGPADLGATVVKEQVLRDRHLSAALADIRVLPRDATLNQLTRPAGLDCSLATLIAPNLRDGTPVDCRYLPDEQTWEVVQTAEGKVAYWIGWNNGQVPQPNDLLRREVIFGNTVEDGQGRKWQVPIARAAGAETGCLPKRYAFDPITSATTTTVRDDMLWLWRLAGEIWDYCVWHAQESEDRESEPPEASKISMDGLAQAALKVLSVNYRIGPKEASVLGVFEDKTVMKVLQACVNWGFIVEVKKKQAQRLSSSSSPGDAADSPTTPPATAN